MNNLSSSDQIMLKRLTRLYEKSLIVSTMDSRVWRAPYRYHFQNDFSQAEDFLMSEGLIWI